MSQTKKGFARIGRDRASRALLLFALLALVVAIAWSALSGKKARVEISSARTPPTIDSTQGGAQVSAQYNDNLLQANQQRVAEARRTGTSALPTVTVEQVGNKLPSTLDTSREEAPRPPVMQPQAPQPARQQAPAAQSPFRGHEARAQAPAGAPVDEKLVSAMNKQMDEISKGMRSGPVATTAFYNPQGQSAPGAQPAGGQAPGGQGFAPQANGAGQAASPLAQGGREAGWREAERGSRLPVPAAGTILYSRLIGRVNSDAPGPVIGEILQGPYAGARLLGSFQSGEAGAVLSFQSMTVVRTVDGVERAEPVPIKAVAVDTQHLGTAMATDIDRHLFERIAVGFATSFLQGLGAAIGSSGATTFLDPSGGAVINSPLRSTADNLLQAGGTAAGRAGQIFERAYGNRKTTVTVDADTPFGLLFLPNSN